MTANRVGRLLPCESGKFLFVKPNRGSKRKDLNAWIGGHRGFGPGVIAYLCHAPNMASSEQESTTTLQHVESPRTNHSSTANSKPRSCSGRLRRLARKVDSNVDFEKEDTDYVESDDTSMEDTDHDPVETSVPRQSTGGQYRAQSCLNSKSPLPSTTIERRGSARIQAQDNTREDHTPLDAISLAGSASIAIKIPSLPASLTVTSMATNEDTQKGRSDVTIQAIIDIWGTETWRRVFEGKSYSSNMLKAAQSFATICRDWATAAQYILHAFCERVRHPPIGQRQPKSILLICDMQNAPTLYEEESEGHVSVLTAEQLLDIAGASNLATRLLPIPQKTILKEAAHSVPLQRNSLQEDVQRTQATVSSTSQRRMARKPRLMSSPCQDDLSESVPQLSLSQALSPARVIPSSIPMRRSRSRSLSREILPHSVGIKRSRSRSPSLEIIQSRLRAKRSRSRSPSLAIIPHPIENKRLRSHSPSLDTTQNSSSKRVALDSTDIVFNFIIPLPEGKPSLLAPNPTP